MKDRDITPPHQIAIEYSFQLKELWLANLIVDVVVVVVVDVDDDEGGECWMKDADELNMSLTNLAPWQYSTGVRPSAFE